VKTFHFGQELIRYVTSAVLLEFLRSPKMFFVAPQLDSNGILRSSPAASVSVGELINLVGVTCNGHFENSMASGLTAPVLDTGLINFKPPKIRCNDLTSGRKLLYPTLST
jgi:hypothetical protein